MIVIDKRYKSEVIGYQGKRLTSLSGHMDSQSQTEFFFRCCYSFLVIHFWFDLVCFRNFDDVLDDIELSSNHHSSVSVQVMS